MFPNNSFFLVLLLDILLEFHHHADGAPLGHALLPSSAKQPEGDTSYNVSAPRDKRQADTADEYAYMDEDEQNDSLLYKVNHQYKPYLIFAIIAVNMFLCFCALWCMLMLDVLLAYCHSVVKPFRDCFDKCMGIDREYKEICSVADKIYLPRPTREQFEMMKERFGETMFVEETADTENNEIY